MNLLSLLLTLSTALAQMPPVPSAVAPPANTNHYWLGMQWTNQTLCASTFRFTYGLDLLSMTNVVSIPETNSSFLVNVSNLLYGKTYWFDFGTAPCATNTQAWLFPPPQPALTNTVTIGCTGPLQMKLLGWNSAWVDVTGRVFRLTQSQSYFWRSKAREMITLAMSNNQVNNAQFMHRQ